MSEYNPAILYLGITATIASAAAAIYFGKAFIKESRMLHARAEKEYEEKILQRAGQLENILAGIPEDHRTKAIEAINVVMQDSPFGPKEIFDVVKKYS